MTSVVRYASVLNSTGAVFTITNEKGLIDMGKNYGIKTFRRTFAAADIGTDAGQTRDTTDPTTGCLLVQITGALIKDIVSWQLFRPTTAANQSFNQVMYATADHYFKHGWRVTGQRQALYLFDMGDDASTRIAANDFVVFSLLIGNN